MAEKVDTWRSPPLPIDAALPELLAALAAGSNAVLVAEPGAGKTTRVPLALLEAPWRGDGRILLLEPRRLAARAAARRMAESLGEEVGGTVGYRVRMESRVSARTRDLENANTRLAHANAEIDQIADALRRSEARLRLIIDSIPALIAYVGRDEVYRFANKGYAEWFEIDKDAIVGKTIAEVFGEKAYAQILPHLLKAKEGERVSYEYARTLHGKRTVYARSVVVPELDGTGEVIGFFVLSIDITEQKAHQAALIQAQKMEAVGQLTGGLAHDFNNLLSVIIGNLSALQERSPSDDRNKEFVAPALHAAQRGAELIKRLLTFSRRQALEPSAVEVSALVQNMLHLLTRSLPENVDIRTRLPDEPVYVFADPHQLENALLNLALNSRDAMPNGGNLVITVSCRELAGSLAKLVELPDGQYVQIDVSDTGSGIEDEALPRLFEPFFTTKPFGRGSGLGLSMVYGFVRQSGGNIRIRSKPGDESGRAAGRERGLVKV